MTNCVSPNDLMNVVSAIVNRTLQEYLLCGVLQGGLKACSEDGILPRDTQIVLCRQLSDLVQQGIDSGEIVAPTVVRIETNETKLILTLANGDQLEVDLTTAVNRIAEDFFVDCNGDKISLGTAIVTCHNLQDTITKLETEFNNSINDLQHELDKNTQDLQNQINLWKQELEALTKSIEQKLDLITKNLEQYVELKTAEWANTILRELIDLVHEMQTVFHDDSLIGDGHEPAPLRVNPEWLNEQIGDQIDDAVNEKLPEIIDSVTKGIKLTDCDGESHTLDTPIVTCAELENFKSELAQQIEDIDIELVDCSGNTIKKGAGVVSCDEFATYKKEIEQQIDSIEVAVDLVDCSGNKLENGSAVVSCESFENYVSKQEAEWRNQVIINNKIQHQLDDHADRIQQNEDSIEEIKGKLDLYALAIPLDMTLKSMRGTLNVGVEILGYGFTVHHLEIDKEATVEIIDTNPHESSPTVVGYIWPEMNQAKGITVPIYDCNDIIIGWASGASFLNKNLVELKV